MILQTNGASSNSKSSTVAMKQVSTSAAVEAQAFHPEPDPQLESESASTRNVESEPDIQQISKLYPDIVSDSKSEQIPDPVQLPPVNELGEDQPSMT